MSSKKPTSAERIRLTLAKRIMDGSMPPGTALDESVIAAELDASRTPVREALRQLASSGLIEQRPHRKSIVTQPDREALEGMFEVMAFLEGRCASLSASRMTLEERIDLETFHNRMQQIVHSGANDDYVLANEAFHGRIYDGSHNAYMADLARTTRQRLQPFRRAQFATLGRLAASHAEHSAIVDAILRADHVAAENLMRSHISFVEQSWHRFAGDTRGKA